MGDNYIPATCYVSTQMSDVELASRYAAENYPTALHNLAKRYQNEDSAEAVHYSELGFGDISDQQAKTALRFFADIELLENPKGANYIPPQSVLDWQLKMGDTSQQGKQEVYETLMEYEVFDEIVFVLDETEESITALAEQVGGMVGIDEDELADMEKTIEVFVECGFLEQVEEGLVRIAEDLVDSEDGEDTETPQQASSSAQDESATSSVGEGQPSVEDHGNGAGVKPSPPEGQYGLETPRRSLTADLEITMDATEMDPEDLREKLEIIDETVAHDGA